MTMHIAAASLAEVREEQAAQVDMIPAARETPEEKNRFRLELPGISNSVRAIYRRRAADVETGLQRARPRGRQPEKLSRPASNAGCSMSAIAEAPAILACAANAKRPAFAGWYTRCPMMKIAEAQVVSKAALFEDMVAERLEALRRKGVNAARL